MVIYGKIKQDAGKILCKLCEQKNVEIMEATLCPDQIHMLVSILPKYLASDVVGYLKGKSFLEIFEGYANFKYKYGNRKFWCKGYYVDSVGRNEKSYKKVYRGAMQEDRMSDQLVLKELVDPFADKNVQLESFFGETLVSAGKRGFWPQNKPYVIRIVLIFAQNVSKFLQKE